MGPTHILCISQGEQGWAKQMCYLIKPLQRKNLRLCQHSCYTSILCLPKSQTIPELLLNNVMHKQEILNRNSKTIANCPVNFWQIHFFKGITWFLTCWLADAEGAYYQVMQKACWAIRNWIHFLSHSSCSFPWQISTIHATQTLFSL